LMRPSRSSAGIAFDGSARCSRCPGTTSSRRHRSISASRSIRARTPENRPLSECADWSDRPGSDDRCHVTIRIKGCPFAKRRQRDCRGRDWTERNDGARHVICETGSLSPLSSLDRGIFFGSRVRGDRAHGAVGAGDAALVFGLGRLLEFDGLYAPNKRRSQNTGSCSVVVM
jgi:hypothetical protein